MRFTLKDFQVIAADQLMAALLDARPAAARGRPQAVVLSSPTGSGKTVIATEMIERVFYGHDGQPGDPKAVVLWLSDQPQLNEQSKKKIAEASDKIPPHRLVTIEHPFNPERLLPGHVYFLNNQKLAVSSLITKQGDKQERTIWQIIEATTKAAPASFYLIIDEAHRGMQDAERGDAARKSAETKRLTITQKFIKGDAGVGDPPTPLSAVPLVVGISATPERFNRVLEGTTRTVHPVVVEPENVRGSGLIKDRIKLAVADEGDEADWSMLADAAKKWAKYRDEWAAYCAKNQITPVITPVLVVQVENGTKEQPTKTNLTTCLKVIQDAVGHLPGNAFAHCFEDDADVPAGNVVLRKVEASKIQHDPDLRVVFFKTALTTGWDCPRAEVMMSFRAAQDSTLIAQLVGRMVRTPLARRVESNEFLNGVSLALPHYDEDAVKDIIKKLEDAEAGATGEVVEEREMVLYKKAEGKDDLFAALAKVPTYVVTRPRRMPETSRLMKLARRLSMDGVGDGLMGKAKRFVIDRLLEQRERLRKDPEWAARVEGSAKVPVKEFTIEYGLWKLEHEPASYMIEATEENIYELFQRCADVLGENLHDSYANRAEFRGDINAARLELFCIVQDEKALKTVQQACEQEFNRIWQEHKDDIVLMSAPAQERYRDLRRRGGSAAAETIIVRDNIEVRAEKPMWDGHLYVNAKGKFGWNANTWEKPVLETEMERLGFAGFLRNMPRKDWALCIPYGAENDKSLYPDMLVFRRVKNKVVIDILDPHGDQFADALGKAQGLAHYAKAHGDLFGRIEMIRIEKGKAERLDLQDEKVRGKVLKATSAEQLADLYVEHG